MQRVYAQDVPGVMVVRQIMCTTDQMIRHVRKYDASAVVDKREPAEFANSYMVAFEMDDEGVRVTDVDVPPFVEDATYAGECCAVCVTSCTTPVMEGSQ